MRALHDGRRAAVVSINGQITPERDEERCAELRRIYELAVCAALRQGENNADILGENSGGILNLP